MANITAAYSKREMSDAPVLSIIELGVEASTKLYQGGLIAVDASGYAVSASGHGGTVVIGRNENYRDNSGNGTDVFSGNGTAGAITTRVKRGTFKWDNGTGVDAIGVANIEQIAYCVDDHTVGATAGTASGAATAARLPVGRIVQVDSDGVWVETNGTATAANGGPVDVVMPAAAAIAAGTLVTTNSAGRVAASAAGDPSLGVTVNAPAGLNAAAVVRVFGFHPAVKSSTTINIGSFFESDASGSATAMTATSVSSTTVVAGERMGVALTAGASASTFAAFLFPRGIPATTQV